MLESGQIVEVIRGRIGRVDGRPLLYAGGVEGVDLPPRNPDELPAEVLETGDGDHASFVRHDLGRGEGRAADFSRHLRLHTDEGRAASDEVALAHGPARWREVDRHLGRGIEPADRQFG